MQWSITIKPEGKERERAREREMNEMKENKKSTEYENKEFSFRPDSLFRLE